MDEAEALEYLGRLVNACGLQSNLPEQWFNQDRTRATIGGRIVNKKPALWFHEHAVGDKAQQRAALAKVKDLLMAIRPLTLVQVMQLLKLHLSRKLKII